MPLVRNASTLPTKAKIPPSSSRSLPYPFTAPAEPQRGRAIHLHLGQQPSHRHNEIRYWCSGGRECTWGTPEREHFHTRMSRRGKKGCRGPHTVSRVPLPLPSRVPSYCEGVIHAVRKSSRLFPVDLELISVRQTAENGALSWVNNSLGSRTHLS
jgi:hypothetical protein